MSVCACLICVVPMATAQQAQQEITNITSSHPIDRLVFHTENFAPYQYADADGTPQGWVFEVLDGIMKMAGAETRATHVTVAPWARSYHLALEMPNHVVFSTARTEARESDFIWVGPYFVSRMSVIGPAGSTPFEQSLGFLQQQRIAAVRDDVSFHMATDAGLTRMVLRETPETAVQLLASGKIRYMVLAEDVLMMYLAQHQIDHQFRPLHVLGGGYNYFAVNPDSDGEAVKQFQQAFLAYTKTADFKRLVLDRYPEIAQALP